MHVNIPINLSFLPERECHTLVAGNKCGKIIPKGNIAGHIDGIITDMMMEDCHYEHKAINHFTFNSYWENYPEDYIYQTSLYNMGLQLIGASNKSLLLIKNKNTAQYLEFQMTYNRDTDTTILTKKVDSTGNSEDLSIEYKDICLSTKDKFEKVYKCSQLLEMPEREYDISQDWQCEYCPWGLMCWENYEEEFNALKTDFRLPDEFSDYVRFLGELSAQRKEIEKQEKDVKVQIVNDMKKFDIKEGLTNDYLFRRILKKRKSVNHELIPKDILEKATTMTFYEQLYTPKRRTK